jgi:hypothetical protein
LFDDAVVEGQVAQRRANPFKGDQFVGKLLQVYLVGEFLDRHRRGTHISQPLQRVDRPAPPLVREGVAHVHHAVGVARAQRAKQRAVHCHVHQVQHQVIGQLDRFHKLAIGLQTSRVDELHQQGQQLVLVDSG